MKAARFLVGVYAFASPIVAIPFVSATSISVSPGGRRLADMPFTWIDVDRRLFLVLRRSYGNGERRLIPIGAAWFDQTADVILPSEQI